MGPVGHVAVVVHRAVGRGVLQEAAERVLAEDEVLGGFHDDVDPDRLGAALHHLDGLRVAVLRHVKRGGVAAAVDPIQHHHRLRRGRRLVEQRRVGDLQARQVDRHVLEVEERFQAALCNLGLVGRVLGVPGRIFQDVALDDGGRVGVAVAHADERAPRVVLGAGVLGRVEHLLLGEGGRQVEGGVGPDRVRNGRVDEGVERLGPEGVEHGVHVGVRGAEVTLVERVCGREINGHLKAGGWVKRQNQGVRSSGHSGICPAGAPCCPE